MLTRFSTTPLVIDRRVARAFWQQRSAGAADPRSVTLDRAIPSVLSRWEVRLYQDWFSRELLRHRSRIGLAVDLGCGNGQWTEVLARLSDRLVAFDFSPGFVAACRARLERAGLGARTEVSCADVATAPLPRGADLVVAGAVTQYLGDAEASELVARVASALAPGGIFYLRTTVSRRARTITRLTEAFQGIYRPAAWYEQVLSRSGLRILRRATATEFVPDELAARHGAWLRRPIGALWRALRAWKRNDIVAYFATPR